MPFCGFRNSRYVSALINLNNWHFSLFSFVLILLVLARLYLLLLNFLAFLSGFGVFLYLGEEDLLNRQCFSESFYLSCEFGFNSLFLIVDFKYSCEPHFPVLCLSSRHMQHLVLFCDSVEMLATEAMESGWEFKSAVSHCVLEKELDLSQSHIIEDDLVLGGVLLDPSVEVVLNRQDSPLVRFQEIILRFFFCRRKGL